MIFIFILRKSTGCTSTSLYLEDFPFQCFTFCRNKKSIAVIESDIVDSSLSVFTLGRGEFYEFLSNCTKSRQNFMTLNNLELRHNARGISSSKPLEHLEPIQCGRYRAWKLGSDTLKTIYTPRHVDIKSVILPEKLSVCKRI